jgi:hypothetical protein
LEGIEVNKRVISIYRVSIKSFPDYKHYKKIGEIIYAHPVDRKKAISEGKE